MTQLPAKIGKYTIKGCLGEGAMGVVYEGYDADIERQVAIKTLKPELVESEGSDFLVRFKREAQAVAKCNHQNIVFYMLERCLEGSILGDLEKFGDEDIDHRSIEGTGTGVGGHLHGRGA